MCGGELYGDDSLSILGVSIDSRQMPMKGLFVCLPGLRVDGHNFIAEAESAGAVCALVEKKQAVSLTQIVVDSCALALRRLASAWRAQFSLPVVAITGSNGKTTVKEMLAAICRFAWAEDAVCQNTGNRNNLLGLPLTLLTLRKHHRVAVLEVGMEAPGELTKLGNLAMPQTALINNAQRAHLGGFNSIAEIAESKAELLQTLPDDGTAVLNADDVYVETWKKTAGSRKIFSFGETKNADYRAKLYDDRLFFESERTIKLRVAGLHNAKNALAAAACARVLGIGFDAVSSALQNFGGVSGRLQHKTLANGVVLIDDTYNANPDSTLAALEVLLARSGKRVAILGDMLSLGVHAAIEHKKIVAAIGDNVLLLAHGENMKDAIKGVANAHYFVEKSKLIDFARQELDKADGATSVLVKGSRGMAMEEICAALERSL